MKTLAILGSGNLGQQIANYAISDNHYSKVVFFDDFSTEKTVLSHPVLGKIKDVIKSFELQQFDELLIGIGYNHLEVKKELFDKFNNIIPFGKIIHSSSWIDSKATIEAGCVIYPSCTIDANVVIKTNTILNIGCTIAHDTIIESNCFLSPRVAIAGFVIIQDCCVLGINSTVIDNITITSKSQLGAATVVIKNIVKSGLYVGNPAKFIR